MPTYERRCSECGDTLKGRRSNTKTCSDLCRRARTRRLAQENKGEVPATQQLAQAMTGEFKDEAHEVIREELRPVVREAMTEDVLRAINTMVALTPRAVAALQEDLANEDPVIRQRAYTLLLKYTVGHPAVVQAKDTDPNQQLVVNLNLPRPDASADPEEAEVVEVRTCDACATEKPTSEFVGFSDRCTECYDRRQTEVLAQFGDA